MIQEKEPSPRTSSKRLQAQRKKLSLQESFNDGSDESWLVSYADMITLLLGFFVVLFSFAMENRSEFEENMKKLSTAKNLESEKLGPERTTGEEPRKSSEALQAEIDSLKLQIEEFNQIKVSFDDLKNLLLEKQTKIEELEEQIESTSDIQNQLKLKEDEIARLKDENQKLTKAFMEFQKMVRNSGETLRTIAEQATESLDLPIQDPVELTKKLNDALLAQKKMQEELFELKGPNGASQRFIFSVFKWESERHDIDLKVTDVDGRVFDIDQKSHPGKAGDLILTSALGPGAEIWEAKEPPSGVYIFRMTMKNNNGNLAPTSVTGMIQSNRSSIKIQGSLIQSNPGSFVEFKVMIDDKGMIRLVL